MTKSTHARSASLRARGRRFFQPRFENLEDRVVPDAGFGALTSTGVYDPGHLLVRFQPGTRPESVLPAGARVAEKLPLVSDLYVVTFGADQTITQIMGLLRNNPKISLVQPDYQVSIGQIPNDPSFSSQLGSYNPNGPDISADVAWDITTGTRRIIVAVLDTGVDYNHPDLAANIWTNSGEIAGNGIDDDQNGYVDDIHGYDFANLDADPMDDHSHGTHVAGIIGAVGNNGIGVAGVNWAVQIMPVKFLSASGSGSTSDALQALNYAVNMGAQISNNSWGGSGYNQALYDGINNARARGHIYVAAAGNYSSNNDVTPFYPASYSLDNVVSVAASTSSDSLASFSNYGLTSVDIAAPGEVILSTIPGGGYAYKSGTSMAAPYVTGALSLVWDYHPTWTYDQVIDALYSGADRISSLSGLVATGGRLNLARALSTAQSPSPPSVSINNVTLLEGDSGTTAFTFTVALSEASAQTVSVSWSTSDGSAVSGSDFTGASGKVTFVPGETSATVTVYVNGDGDYEPNESFSVLLSGATNAVIGDGVGTGTITNDDVTSTPVLAIDDDAEREGNTGWTQFTFTISLSAASSQSTTVRWGTVAGTAAGGDFTSANGTLVFNPGELVKTIKIKVKGEKLIEADESFSVVLSTPSNATIGRSQGVGTIINDDGGAGSSVLSTSVAAMPKLADLFRMLGDFDLDWLNPVWKRRR